MWVHYVVELYIWPHSIYACLCIPLNINDWNAIEGTFFVHLLRMLNADTYRWIIHYWCFIPSHPRLQHLMKIKFVYIFIDCWVNFDYEFNAFSMRFCRWSGACDDLLERISIWRFIIPLSIEARWKSCFENFYYVIFLRCSCIKL